MKLRDFVIQISILLVCLGASGRSRKTIEAHVRSAAPRSSDFVSDYKNANLPIGRRVSDLLGRITLEEKVRQLDLYSGAGALVDKRSDSTHATGDAIFLPDKAQILWGSLGVGGIHDLYPLLGVRERPSPQRRAPQASA